MLELLSQLLSLLVGQLHLYLAQLFQQLFLRQLHLLFVVLLLPRHHKDAFLVASGVETLLPLFCLARARRYLRQRARGQDLALLPRLHQLRSRNFEVLAVSARKPLRLPNYRVRYYVTLLGEARAVVQKRLVLQRCDVLFVLLNFFLKDVELELFGH